jgi:transposase/predicted phosphodiesterase
VGKPEFKTFKVAYYNVEELPDNEALAAHFGVTTRTLNYWLKAYVRDGEKLKARYVKKNEGPEQPIQLESIRLKEQVKTLESEIASLQKLALSSERLVNLIHGSNKQFNKTPSWLNSSKAKKELHGIPCLFLSDIHFDEFVDPAQINGVNQYSRQIARQRIQNVFETSINILTKFIAKPKYDGAVVALGGDLLSGNIHEELVETNEAPILSSVLELTQLLIDGITLYATTFEKVFVPCVVGNHGRLNKKPKCKNRVFDNYEWLIYQNLSRHFDGDDRVTFYIPDGPDAIFNIYNKTFLLTHGDQFKGGSGISGIMSPLHLGLHRKQKKQAAIHQSFDVMILGHFHQYIHTNSMIVNGSVKGYDEFANLCNFAFEPPQQALWINHPTHGMVFRTPVLCDKTEKDFSKLSKIEVFK